MARWVKITQDDLLDHKVAALVEQLQTVALAEGQDDPTPGIIRRVVDRVRRKIASCPTNRVDADPETFPAGLHADVLDLVIIRLKGRLESPLTEQEERELDRIETDLNRIAACRDTVEQPDAPIAAPVEGGGGVELISSTRPIASRRQTAGL